MTETTSSSYTVFQGDRRLAAGGLDTVALAAKHAFESGTTLPILIYHDATGRVVDIDPTGTDDDLTGRLARAHPMPSPVVAAPEVRGRGRPKLGVIAREVTLLPRHWDWLATQPGGASVAIRKLVEDARRGSGDKDRLRAAQEAAYRFMSAMAGDREGFEEASRALFANDQRRFAEMVASWPADVRDYAISLAFAVGE